MDSKRAQAFVLPNICLQAKAMDVSENNNSGTTIGLRHDNTSGSRLTLLTPVMPNRHPRSINIVEGGNCPDTRYEEQVQEKAARHQALDEALRTVVTMLPHCP